MSEVSLTRPRAPKGSGALGPVRDTLTELRGAAALFVAAVAGAVGNLAFAPFHVVPVLAASLVTLVWMIDGARREKRWGRAVFSRAFAFGFGHFVVGLHWIANAFAQVEGTLGFVWIAVLVLPAILATVWGVFLLMAGAFWSSSPSRIFVFALFFGLAEYVRGTLFGGFPWNVAATAWVPGGAISQSASLVGLYGLTTFTLLVLASPAALSDDRERSGLAVRALPLLGAAVALSLAWTWGTQRLQADAVMTQRHAVLIDAGIPQKDKLDASADMQLRRFLELMTNTPGDASDIVVWPEAPIRPVLLDAGDGRGRPAGLIEWPDALDAIATYLDGRTLITGSRHYVGGWEAPTYNALALIESVSARIGPKALYYKHRLVPLGELAAVRFVPFGEHLAGLLPPSLQTFASDGFTPGPGPSRVEFEGVPSFVPLICYEGLFPEIARSQGDGAEWLVNISIDGWFGSGVGPEQLYAQSRFRAIETGLPLARSASRGVTAMVDPYGRETARGGQQTGDPEGWRASVVRTPIPQALSATPYLRFGNAGFWCFLVVLTVLALTTWRRKIN
jgi:apolipoprotein N-acyltransferase